MGYSLATSTQLGYSSRLKSAFRALILSCAILVTSIPTLAQDASAQAPTSSMEAPAQPTPPTLMQVLGRMMPMFIVVFFIFYFMVIKPQQAKQKNQLTLLRSLKKGDGIITTSGIHGKVVSVEDTHVMIEIAQNVRVKVERDHIARRDQ